MGGFLCEMLVLVLGAAGIVLLFLANETDCWRRDAKDLYASVGLSFRCRGLWSECILDYMANVWTCDVSLSYLGKLPDDVRGVRILMIVACGICMLAVPPLVCGMRCTKLVSGHFQMQKLTHASGLLFLFGGMSGTGGLLWYGTETFTKYQEEELLGIPGVTYELGYSYWVAAGGVACTVSSGLALVTLKPLTCKSGPSRRTQTMRAAHSSGVLADGQWQWATRVQTYV